MNDAAIDARWAFSQEIGQRAGALAFEHWRAKDRLVVETKSHRQDIVSEADRAVERLIRDAVAEAFPGDAFLGEEYGFTPGASGFTWVVDPIDGTSPYLHGIPDWCVAIAVVADGRTVAGAIEAPAHGDRYAARLGGGATRNGAPMRIAPDVSILNTSCAFGTGPRSDPAETAERVRRLMDAGGVFFSNGSGAVMLAYVASGRLAGYLTSYMNSWDCLAGLLMIGEAGGRVTDFAEHRDLETPRPVLAAAPGAWDALAAIRDG